MRRLKSFIEMCCFAHNFPPQIVRLRSLYAKCGNLISEKSGLTKACGTCHRLRASFFFERDVTYQFECVRNK
ncbi:hypothetical protein FD51_GL001130 [Lacticaseibacillus zeae DSM 20178 = KCTC 3804]|uniref:Uncharacterized protein n=1 Tax=Lacticaseibacillus zeae DSM 20178 = KCTC 3804 TaxID=1423816 RepID=A0A0R1EWI9_LACZE|nr:hypothetical protein FD51_GL001130 [Lacticaseibacillus zeae DSM 20178 = KCTC 3804]